VTPIPFSVEALTSVRVVMMAEAFVLEVSEVDHSALQARSRLRREAVRARVILLSLEGFTSHEIGLILEACPSAVREWRGRYARGGLDALRYHKPQGRNGSAGRQAVTLAKEILEADTAHDQQWTLGRLRAEVIRRGGPALSESRLAKLLKKTSTRGGDRGTPSRGRKSPCWAPGTRSGAISSSTPA
jgi:transposase